MASNLAKTCTLQLRGELTIKTAAETHRTLTKACGEAHQIVIDLADCGETDLTLVQMILAARRFAEREGKTLRLSAPLAASLQHDLARGGFLSANDSAFWTAKE